MKELIAIQTELNVPKNQTNKFGGYNYRSCEDITEALKPLLKKYQCMILMEDHVEARGTAFVCKDVTDMGYEDRDGNWHPDIREVETVKGMRYFTVATATLINAAGEKVSCTAEAEHPESKKGMDPAQVSGATSSYARKYALGGLFALDDNRDPDATNDHGKTEKVRRHGTAGSSKPQKAVPAPAPAPAAPEKSTAEKQLEFMAKLNVSQKMIEDALGKPFAELTAQDNAFLRAVVQLMLKDKLNFEDAVQRQCVVEQDNTPGAAQ